jgi:class 3 adenylate cyclase
MFSSRQLVAIIFTDIVGYTALMGDDEQKIFKLFLNGIRRTSIRVLIKYSAHEIS